LQIGGSDALAVDLVGPRALELEVRVAKFLAVSVAFVDPGDAVSVFLKALT